MTGSQLATAAFTIAFGIAQGKSPNDISILGDIFSQIGATLTVIADDNLEQ